MVNNWTKDDLPTVDEAAETYMTKGVYSVQEGIALVLDAVVAHLNASGGLPASDDRWRRAHAIVEQERDQAREQWKKWEYKANEWRTRAEAAEKRHTWPKVTPTGHTYVAPDTYLALCHQHSNAAQAEVECWEADECPPEPTWEMVGIAHREVERIQRDYCECQEELVEASLERDQWMARAEAAEARTAPADPVVLVIGESDVEACQVRRRPPSSLTSEGDWEAADQTWLYFKGVTVEELDEEIDVNIRGVVEALAVRRAIEAEQAVDPLLDKAQEFGALADWELTDREAELLHKVAAHILGRSRPVTARERVAREWHAQSDHAAVEPFGGPLCNCWRVADRIVPMLRDAWEDAVEMAADKGWLHVDAVADTSDRNPYRAEGDRHVDQ